MLQVAEAVQITDTGRQREANEDSYFSRAPLFAVADGMGGAQAGEVASRMAVEAFERVDEETAAPEDLLRRTAQEANREIFELAQGDATHSGMGTTLTAALLHGDEISFGHVGDSRAYVFREGKLRQITNDHSLVEELRRQGKLTRDQAAEHPQRSVITRALGPEPTVDVDTLTFSARPGDVFLLCSDGLTTMLDDEDVATIVARAENLQIAARRLVKAANERGGRDNITAVLFRLEPVGAAADEGETLIGPSADQAGFSAEAIAAGVAASGGAAAPEAPTGPPPPRRRPRRPGAVSPAPKRRWPRRVLKGVVTLLAAVLVAFVAVVGVRQVWFVGTDDAERLALFRGLPYELPFGVELYSEQAVSRVPLEALPQERRAVATDHELRSEDDARSLLEDLENAAVTTPGPGGGGSNGGGPGGGAGGSGTGGGSPDGGGSGGGSSGGGGGPSGGGNG